MTSTHSTTIAVRVGQCVAATALMAGIAFGATPIAVAERVWDIDRFDKCMAPVTNSENELTIEQLDAAEQHCCRESGGDIVDNDGVGPSAAQCTAPPAEAENVPAQPTQSTTPPVLQNPTRQPANPVIPTVRGPISGTLAQP